MGNIRRIYVEKKAAFSVEAHGLLEDLRNNLGMHGLKNIRIINRYDVMGLNDEEFSLAKKLVLSEPPVDTVIEEKLPLPDGCRAFVAELLPGQYDQREDFAEQCIQLITQKERPIVAAGEIYVLEGQLPDAELDKIKAYCINPVEAREAGWEKPDTLLSTCAEPEKISTIAGFLTMTGEEAESMRSEMGLAMSLEDLLWCQKYFTEEQREPTVTEIRVLDTYWSDHCRHTTFMTQIDKVEIVPGLYTKPVKEAYDKYLAVRNSVYGKDTERPITLMDMAVIGMKELRKHGLLEDLDESEEINACSIVVPVEIDNKTEEWLVMFKNETHNHPTEIEPFGGAATCLGGAIRDPLSGRSYVYQAMRVTGSADPRVPVAETIEGKLPQRKITIGAAAGYSSYGNQIGLATGHVQEYYHDKFIAKRMEIGAVISAAPQSAVRRERPVAGDVVVLLGGRTGRDGCGGATGSSKEHTVDSIMSCGAEVQKGNPLTERKLQRLFRNPEVTKMIKRCNDFGAGGVSVAIGELADGLVIDLDKVPKKYEGLDGTELAISESQERMAVVIAADDTDAFIRAADAENVEATVVAEVSDISRLVMYWRGDKIVDILRTFLDTNGVAQHTEIVVKDTDVGPVFKKIPQIIDDEKNLKTAWLKNLGRLNVCSQKGLAERFDSTIGRGTVIMPFGGRRQMTPSEGMVSHLPVMNGKTTASSIMACGYNPYIACRSPFHGALYAVMESVARAVALGGNPEKLRLSLQEYFPRLHNAENWGQPFSALLGAFTVLNALKLPAIGGKDSMSGTFMDKTVPPSLVSFAVSVTDDKHVLSAEFKQPGSTVIALLCPVSEEEVPDFRVFKKNLIAAHEGIRAGKVSAAAVVKEGGIAALMSIMCMGNKFGFEFTGFFDDRKLLFAIQPGAMILELAKGVDHKEIFNGLNCIVLGHITEKPVIRINDIEISLDEAEKAYREPLQGIFPDGMPETEDPEDIEQPLYEEKLPLTASVVIAKPRVFIPVFPGINCEYDSARAFTEAGAVAETFVIRNLTAQAIEESVVKMVELIYNSQIIMIPGGFSAGDEPDGSGKFIATMFRSPKIKEAVNDLLENRDGLMLGICNGFQALIKLGLVPYGEIRDMDEMSPTLTFNTIGRHISHIVSTKVVSNKSPWLSCCNLGDIYSVAVSHGEGRFYAPPDHIRELFAGGQVATQYVNEKGIPTMNTPYNPNGSLYAIEGITSPDGRVFGKMGHTERYAPGLFRNIYGNKEQMIFRGGVNYFK
ncbi:MAG: phosphoribosylformylglycinamidine synthase [Phascolarctobacterium sp.]|nr:phosphoribosylformylglycinamidine synthase [Phascolarctobacterium sp.]